MNYMILGLVVGLTLTTGTVACTAITPPAEQSTPIAKSTPISKSTSVVAKSTTAAQPKSGRFISAEHETKGTATIVQENGTYFIELDQAFETSSNGPDLFVILHRSPDILKITRPPDYAIAEGDYVNIAPLKSFNGKQRYEIPSNVQLDNYKSVAIWCRKYNATFGFAPLSSK